MAELRRHLFGLAGVVVGLWACGNSHPPPDASVSDVVATEVADDAAPSATDTGSAGCPASEEACVGVCLPACPTATTRKFAPDCRCFDDSKVATLPTAAPDPLTADRGHCLAAQLPLGQSAHDKARRQQFFDAAKYLGVRALRTDVRWDEIEPKQGAFEWAPHDTLVGELQAHGIELLALIAYGNTWASKEGKAANDIMYPPDDPKDFATFAAAVAKRYQGKVKRYEVWNEQNAGFRFWKGTNTFSGDPKAYAKLLLLAAQAIHGVDAKAEVAFGGLFYLPQAVMGAEEFTDKAYAAEPLLAQHVNAHAWHPYALYPPVDPPEFAASKAEAGVERVAVDETARRLRKVLAKHGAGDQRLWMTELGWPTEEAVTELDHARFLVRSWVLLDAADVPYRCWYTLMDHPPEAQNVIWEKVFGLYRWDADPTDATPPQPKPAAAAWHNLTQRLRDTVPAGRFPWALVQRSSARREVAYVGSYAGQGFTATWSSVRVLWDESVPDGATTTAHLVARKGFHYRVAQMLDDADQPTATLPKVDPDAQNRIAVPVGRSPVYLIEGK
jgi:hypothetical protein